MHMKRILLLFVVFLIGHYSQAQPGSWPSYTNTWVYDFGTNTGTGQLNGAAYVQGSISTSTPTAASGYLPSPSSGRARLTGHSSGYARWSLAGTTATPSLRFASSHSGRVGKFALYMIANASPVTAVYYTMRFNDSTTTACNWQFALGNTGNHPATDNQIMGTGGISAAGTTSANELFAGVRWQMTGSNFTFAYRDKPNASATITYQPVTTLSFVKGGTYAMEFYCNNSFYEQTYSRGGNSYTLASSTYHMWANGTRLERTAGQYAFPANELPAGNAIDGMVFTGQTSTSGSVNDNAAVLHLNNITVQHATDSAALNALADLLPAQPKGFGNPYTDRSSWDSLRLTGNYNPLINAANSWRTQPLPAITDSIYRLYWTAGNSQSAKSIMTERRQWLSVFTLAECLVNDGTYLPAIRNTIESLITQRSWNFPSEDRDSANFTGTRYSIALCAAAYAHDLAQAIYLLGDKLPDSLRQQVKDALELRIFQPTLQAGTSGEGYASFTALVDKGNHNAACLAGVTGAALTVIEDPVERAQILAIALHYSKNYIAGFTDDGYCSEGLSYYNYGFGFYIQLREKIFQETGGAIDLFSDPKIRTVATFAPRSEIINGLYPSIADCNAGTQPSRSLLFYVNRTLDLGLSNYQTFSYLGRDYSTLPEVMYAFPNTATLASPGTSPTLSTGLRSYFNVAGILTVRPDSSSAFQTGAVFKGGHNGEMHNHNDVGSYSITSGNVMMMGDPGAIPYTAATFNDQRYTYKTINSYGHPVPLINGKQQRTGSTSRAVITDTLFTDTLDRFAMNITSLYKDSVPALNLLQRAFVYNRSSNGYVQVKDSFSFASGVTYVSALTTRVNWRILGPNAIELYSGLQRLRVDIQASTGGYTISSETINEEDGLPYKRLAIQLNGSVTNGTLTMTFSKSEPEPLVRGQWTAADSVWLYNAGTNTGTGQLGGASFDQGTVVNTTTYAGVQGYMPYPQSGSVRLGGTTDGTGKARWWLVGDSADARIRFASSYGGKVGKLAMYDIAQATAVSTLYYTITFNDSTTTQANWQFLIGRTNGSASSTNRINGTSALPGSGTTATPEVFTAVRWLMEAGVFTFAYRDKPTTVATIAWNTVAGISFLKGGSYNMEFYCNNDANAQTYTRAGNTYTVPSHSYQVWANNTQLTTGGSANFPGGELVTGGILDGFTLTGQTSISGSTNNSAAQLWLGDLQVDHKPATGSLRMAAPASPVTFDVRPQAAAGVAIFIGNTQEAGAGSLVLRDLSGQQLAVKPITLVKGHNQVQWPLNTYAKGVYMISLHQAGLPVQTRKIIL